MSRRSLREGTRPKTRGLTPQPLPRGHTHTHTHTSSYTHIGLHARSHTYSHTPAHMHIHSHVRRHAHTHPTCPHALPHTNTHAHGHLHAHTLSEHQDSPIILVKGFNYATPTPVISPPPSPGEVSGPASQGQAPRPREAKMSTAGREDVGTGAAQLGLWQTDPGESG